MKSLRITLPDDLETRFEAHLEASGAPPEEAVRDALRAYLEDDRVHLDGEAYPVPEKPLRFTPAERGSGRRAMSANHDEYLRRRVRAVLAGTGPLFALLDPDERAFEHHERAGRELSDLAEDGRELVVAFPIMVEAYKLILRGLGIRAAYRWLGELEAPDLLRRRIGRSCAPRF